MIKPDFAPYCSYQSVSHLIGGLHTTRTHQLVLICPPSQIGGTSFSCSYPSCCYVGLTSKYSPHVLLQSSFLEGAVLDVAPAAFRDAR